MIKISTFLANNNKLLLVFLCLFLSACGGTSANGVGGTGITSGRVTGFGSMFVNGVKFDTDNAVFIRDGVSSKQQEDFNTGEIVSIKGTVNEGRKTGVATEVTFTDTLEGTVTSAPTENSIEILGQNVITNNLTVFHDFNKLSDLQLGNIVEISGFSSQENITASSIRLVDASFTTGSILEVEGNISALDSDSLTFDINGLTVNYDNAVFSETSETNIANGDFVIVSSDQDIVGDILIATNITSVNNNLLPNTYYEIEGFITEFNSTTDFELDYENSITTNSDTVVTNGSLNDLKLDQLIIAIGTTDANGVLITDEIRFIESSSTLSIEANIETIDIDNSSLVVLGQTINVDSFTLISDDTTEDFSEFNLSQLAVGDSVFVDISVINGENFANRLSKIPALNAAFIEGRITSVDSDLNEFTLANSRIKTDSATFFLNDDGDIISSETFFSSLEEDTSELSVEANYVPNQDIVATEVILFSNL